jgi:hypothetical protein
MLVRGVRYRLKASLDGLQLPLPPTRADEVIE